MPPSVPQPPGESTLEPTSRVEIDLSGVERNLRSVRTALRSSEAEVPGRVCAILKADAYGLGAARVAKRLDAAGVDMVAVYTPSQALDIIDTNISAPILLLMPVRSFSRDSRLYRAASRGQLHLTVHDASNLEGVIEIADGLGITLPVHLELDTGMCRGGVPIDGALAESMMCRIGEHPRLRLAGLSTHFASADADAGRTAEQHERFVEWLSARRHMVPDGCVTHEANTFGVYRSGAFHAGMVRVGLGLFGYASEEFGDAASFALLEEASSLEHVVRWTSRVVQTKLVASGSRVGYGGTWRAARETRLALVPVGYADGYPLSLSNRGEVGLATPEGVVHAPIVGRVSMDQMSVDVTDVPEASSGVGAEVEIVSRRRGAPNSLPELARRAGTITHELLCRVGPRVRRVYVESDAGGAAEGVVSAEGARA